MWFIMCIFYVRAQRRIQGEDVFGNKIKVLSPSVRNFSGEIVFIIKFHINGIWHENIYCSCYMTIFIYFIFSFTHKVKNRVKVFWKEVITTFTLFHVFFLFCLAISFSLIMNQKRIIKSPGIRWVYIEYLIILHD